MAKETPKDKIQKGWIHVLVTFEILGKPAEYVESSLKVFIESIKKDDRVDVMEERVEKAIENKDGFFSAFAEINMLVKNLDTLTWLCINYTPASVEVIEPTEFVFKAVDLQGWINDLLATLHDISMKYKVTIQENAYLRTNLGTLLSNVILLSLARSPKKLPELSKDTSITEEALKSHIDKLLKDKKIKKKGGTYFLA